MRMLEGALSLLAVIIAYLAYRQSIAANEIAEKAYQQMGINTIYSKDKDKADKINKIIEEIVSNWHKNGGAQANLLAQWEIYKNDGFSTEDFDMIWRCSYLKVKKKEPKQSFKELLNNRDNNNV